MSVRSRLLILIITSIFLYSCQSEQDETKSDASKATEAEISEVLRISEDNVDVDDLIFSMPALAVTDAQNRIYALDLAQDMIFKFDADGSFLGTIGRSGRGPGEFQSVRSMEILDRGALFVYDYLSSRGTIFSESGEVDEIFPIEFRSSISNIRNFDDGTLLFPLVKDDYMIQLFDLEKQEITAGLIPMGDVIQSENEHETRFLEFNRGSAIPLSENRIAYAPDMYNGKIHLYQRTETGWEPDSVISGYEHINPSFTVHFNRDEPHERAFSITLHEDGYLGLEFHSMSLGLFPLDNDRFMHLSYRDADPEKTALHLMAELFDASTGELIKYARLVELGTTYPPERLPVYVDRQGMLYVADIEYEPVLRKIEIRW